MLRLGRKGVVIASPERGEELTTAHYGNAAFEMSGTAMAFVSLDGRWMRVNKALCELLGRPPEDLVGRSFQELTHPDDLGAAAHYILGRGGSPSVGGIVEDRAGDIRLTKRYLRPDGNVVHTELASTLLFDCNGNPSGYFTQTFDVTDRVLLQEQLSQDRNRLKAILQHLPVPVAEVEPNGKVAFWNRAAESVFGWQAESVVGEPLPTVVPEDRPRLAEMLAAAMAGRSTGPVEVTRLRRDGTALDISVTCAPVGPVDQQSTRAVLVGMDVTQRKRTELELVGQAFFDPLTGLSNRASFLEHLAEAVKGGKSFVLIALDVAHMKATNDTLGERSGDAVLLEAATRLRSAVGDRGIVARLGGNDFAVLLHGADLKDAQALGDALVQRISGAMQVGSTTRTLRFSVGLTASTACLAGTCSQTPSSSPMGRAKELLREADMAISVAKDQGRTRPVVFSCKFRQDMAERIALTEDLRRALETGALEVAYQPIFSLSDCTTVAAEALSRWHHPDRGAIPPDKFIPLAERAGLVGDLDQAVFLTACRDAVCRPEGPGGPLGVHVNVSASELETSSGLLSHLEAVLSESGLEPNRLVVELTEGVLLRGGAGAIRTLEGIRSLGVRLSLDDFGTGYSALSYLERLPINGIKLDRSFVSGIDTAGPARIAMVSSVLGMADALGIQVVAEGIETRGELEVMASAGYRLGQGWLVGPAVPNAQFTAALASSDRGGSDPKA